jgi:hypothetical protein
MLIVAAAAVAGADIEHLVRSERDEAAVVVGLLVVVALLASARSGLDFERRYSTTLCEPPRLV